MVSAPDTRGISVTLTLDPSEVRAVTIALYCLVLDPDCSGFTEAANRVARKISDAVVGED